MTDFFKKNRVTDPDVAEEGVWVTGVYGGMLDVRIRRTNSSKAQEVLRRLNKPFRNMRNVPPSKQQEINRNWVAEGVLIDWRPSEDCPKELAQEVPACTLDNAIQAFKDDPDFLEEVVGFAHEAETFRQERLQEEGKPSKSTSSGSSGGESTSSSSSSE